jgi:hypothetical protein
MNRKLSLEKTYIMLPLDDNFQPAILWDKEFNEGTKNSAESIPLSIGFERENGYVSVY